MHQERADEADWWQDKLRKLEEELAQGRQKFRKEMSADMERDRRQAEDSSQKMFEELRQRKNWNSNSNYDENKKPTTWNNNKGKKANNSNNNSKGSVSSNNSDWREKLKERRKRWEEKNRIREMKSLQFDQKLAIDHIYFCLDLWEVSENELNQSLGGINWKTEINNAPDWLEISRKKRSFKQAIDKIHEKKELAKQKIDRGEHINRMINIWSKNYSPEEKQELKNGLGNWEYDLCQASSDSELRNKEWQLLGPYGKINKITDQIHQKQLEKIRNTKPSTNTKSSPSMPRYRQRTGNSTSSRWSGLLLLFCLIGIIVGIVMYFRNKKRKQEK